MNKEIKALKWYGNILFSITPDFIFRMQREVSAMQTLTFHGVEKIFPFSIAGALGYCLHPEKQGINELILHAKSQTAIDSSLFFFFTRTDHMIVQSHDISTSRSFHFGIPSRYQKDLLLQNKTTTGGLFDCSFC